MAFGDFNDFCSQASIPLCSVVGSITNIANGVGIEANCYARNIELANTIIFQAATCFIHILALVMTVAMILHVRSKFTAVGRKEITAFFYLYMALTFTSLILDAGVIPIGSGAYPYFTAVQAGFASALCACLLINGFVGFQIYEDGTTFSVWLLRSLSAAMFIITFLVSLATFKSWANLGPTHTIALFVVLYLISGIFLLVYIVMQFVLVINTLEDRWPLGDLIAGTLAIILGQVTLYTLSNTICEASQHFLDGLFIATICNLLAVMMVYKYWDSITKEDLEFSVGVKQNNWEVKELLPDNDNTTAYPDTEYSNSPYHQPHTRNSNYGGFNY